MSVTAQVRVQLFELAALAFPANPFPFAFRPDALAVEKQKSFFPVAGVQCRNPVTRRGENFGVAGRFRVRAGDRPLAGATVF